MQMERAGIVSRNIKEGIKILQYPIHSLPWDKE